MADSVLANIFTKGTNIAAIRGSLLPLVNVFYDIDDKNQLMILDYTTSVDASIAESTISIDIDDVPNGGKFTLLGTQTGNFYFVISTDINNLSGYGQNGVTIYVENQSGKTIPLNGFRFSADGTDGSSTPFDNQEAIEPCLLYTSPSPRDRQKSRMPSSA